MDDSSRIVALGDVPDGESVLFTVSEGADLSSGNRIGFSGTRVGDAWLQPN